MVIETLEEKDHDRAQIDSLICEAFKTSILKEKLAFAIQFFWKFKQNLYEMHS